MRTNALMATGRTGVWMKPPQPLSLEDVGVIGSPRATFHHGPEAPLNCFNKRPEIRLQPRPSAQSVRSRSDTTRSRSPPKSPTRHLTG